MEIFTVFEAFPAVPHSNVVASAFISIEHVSKLVTTDSLEHPGNRRSGINYIINFCSNTYKVQTLC